MIILVLKVLSKYSFFGVEIYATCFVSRQHESHTELSVTNLIDDAKEKQWKRNQKERFLLTGGTKRNLQRQ